MPSPKYPPEYNKVRCSSCGEIKPREEFYRNSKAKSGLQSKCKSCFRKYKAQSISPEFAKFSEKILEEQNHKCAICGYDDGLRALSLDHDHRSGRIRGYLCRDCNSGLGNFHDRPDWLKKAIEYLAVDRSSNPLFADRYVRGKQAA